jgi:hypothetical protein
MKSSRGDRHIETGLRECDRASLPDSTAGTRDKSDALSHVTLAMLLFFCRNFISVQLRQLVKRPPRLDGFGAVSPNVLP